MSPHERSQHRKPSICDLPPYTCLNKQVPIPRHRQGNTHKPESMIEKPDYMNMPVNSLQVCTVLPATCCSFGFFQPWSDGNMSASKIKMNALFKAPVHVMHDHFQAWLINADRLEEGHHVLLSSIILLQRPNPDCVMKYLPWGKRGGLSYLLYGIKSACINDLKTSNHSHSYLQRKYNHQAAH